MKQPLETELVGILIGSLMTNSRPIIILLYIMPDGTGHSRHKEYPEVCTPFYATKKLLHTYGHAARSIWKNEFEPSWYYIQLYPGAQPKEFLQWALPWSALARWDIEPIDA